MNFPPVVASMIFSYQGSRGCSAGMSHKISPLILMKLWDIILICLINMCTKFRQKNCQEVPPLRTNLCLKNYIENPMG